LTSKMTMVDIFLMFIPSGPSADSPTALTQKQITMNIKGIIEKVEHVKLSIYAHPDSQPNSEFADCVDTLEEIIQHLKAHLSDLPTASNQKK
jgi:hypothetical protein